MRLHHLQNSITKRACRFLLSSLVIATAAGPLAYDLQAGAYVYTNIADTNGIFARTGQLGFGSSGISGLSISNNGTVAFASQLDDGSAGIFSGNGGPVTTIALSNGPTFNGFGASVSINNFGTVAFLGFLATGGQGLFGSNAGIITPIALSSEPLFSNFGNLSINDAGTAAFGAGLDAGGAGIFTRNGATTTTIALTTGAGGPFSTFGNAPGINASGRVAFAGVIGGTMGIRTGSGGSVTTVYEGALPQAPSAAINDAGTVAFTIGSGIGSGRAIVTASGGSLTTLFDGNEIAAVGPYPAINSFGAVVFWRGDGLGGTAISVRSPSDSTAAIRTGDILFGSTVTRLSLLTQGEEQGNVDINDGGQVAFHYELANGVQGIAVGTPNIPEPTILVFAFVGTVVLGCGFRRSDARRASVDSV